MEKYDVFFFRLTIAFPLLSRFFFHQPWIWSSEFPILQQNLCFVAAVCSHYVLFSLEKTVLIFFEPRLVLIRPYKDQSSVAWEQVQPLLELLQKGWKEFSHACKAAGEAFFCIPKKKRGCPRIREGHSPQGPSSSDGCFFDTSAARQSTRFCFPK